MMDDLVGTTLGGCRLERLLGAGAIGEVYRGTHLESERQVAVKVVYPGMRTQPGLLDRFEREARLAYQLDHPALISVLHWDVDHEHPYLVMAFIDGATLERMTRYHGQLDWKVAAALVADVADGLEHVHGLGIVHRDLKPANLLVAKTGRGYLADLGLARQVSDAADEVGGRRLTAPGSVMGSPAYMAPEQVADTASAGIPADIWGLGATLYHALGGRPPFIADTPTRVLRSVMRDDPPPLSELASTLPSAVTDLVQACLAKDPSHRPDRAHSVAKRLRQALTQA